MKRGLINGLYDQAHVIHETPYEASVVDPSIVAIHKQKVWDRYLFAELIIEEMYDFIMEQSAGDNGIPGLGKIKQHFGVEE